MTRKVRVMKDGKQVASAKNLEVILRYQRQNSYINTVSQRGKNLTVKYDDGATVKTKFNSETVLRNWIARKRTRGVFPKKKSRRRRRK